MQNKHGFLLVAVSLSWVLELGCFFGGGAPYPLTSAHVFGLVENHSVEGIAGN